MSDINARIFTSILQNDSASVVELINLGWNPNEFSGSLCGYPIPLAITSNSPDVLRVLLDHGADPNLYINDGSPLQPIHLAINSESPELLDILLSCKSLDVNSSVGGATPLMSALSRCDIQTAEKICSHETFVVFDSVLYTKKILDSVYSSSCDRCFQWLIRDSRVAKIAAHYPAYIQNRGLVR